MSNDLVTEITMPMEIQRFSKHFAIAKTESFAPIYEKEWSVSEMGTIDCEC